MSSLRSAPAAHLVGRLRRAYPPPARPSDPAALALAHATTRSVLQLRPAPADGRGRPGPHLALPLPRLSTPHGQRLRLPGALPSRARRDAGRGARARADLGPRRVAHVLVLP